MGLEIQEQVDLISQRQAGQQESEMADLRTSEYFVTHVHCDLKLTRTGVANRLKPLGSAYYDSSVAPTGCLDGTREPIHEQLAEWANDGAQGLTTLWLSGMAGSGKTAIASTFARNMADEGILGATFFIDQKQAERRDLSRIVQTLAYDLGRHSHAHLREIWTVLRDDPTFERLSFGKQARLLIKKPLDIVRPETVVVVIDGLDQCGASEGASLLETLVTSLEGHPIKLFVSSRNEVDIANTFRDIAHRLIELQEMEAWGNMRLDWGIINNVISDILSHDSRNALLARHQDDPLRLLNALQEVS
jgi:hypothetical protein